MKHFIFIGAYGASQFYKIYLLIGGIQETGVISPTRRQCHGYNIIER